MCGVVVNNGLIQRGVDVNLVEAGFVYEVTTVWMVGECLYEIEFVASDVRSAQDFTDVVGGYKRIVGTAEVDEVFPVV